MQIVVFTLLALFAFAANSVLCRIALAQGLIDPANFTAIRLVSAAITLTCLVIWNAKGDLSNLVRAGSWSSGIALFVYAAGFSYAYVWLSAGSGALILFASVQFSMITFNLIRGHVFTRLEWLGMSTALSGFIYLVLPGVSAPPAFGAALMATAGIAWGIYSLNGKGATNATLDTMANFVRTLPLALCLLPFVEFDKMQSEGVLYAVLSGAIASGLGYVIWYKALPVLSNSIAAASQLSVPVIAAIGGVLLLGEQVGYRLGVATIVILGGIALVIFAQQRVTAKK